MLLLLSHAGSAWLDRGANRPEGAAILPGLTIEATPLVGHAIAGEHLIVTSIRSGIRSGRQTTRPGIAVGDTVLAIDGARIFSLDQARRSLQKNRAGTVALRVAHGHDVRDVRLVRSGRSGVSHGPQVAGHRG